MNARTLVRLADLDGRDDWLAARRSGIGASDAAAICGLDPFRSPTAVWLDKVGLGDDVENDAMRWGRRLEAAVADEFAEEHPELVVEAPSAIYQHAERDWMLANPDRLCYPAESPDVLVAALEIKTAGQYVAQRWEHGVPDNYAVQVQHQLEVLDLDAAFVAVLIGGRDYRTFEIKRDPEAIAAIVDIEAEFWDRYVLAGSPPPVDGHESTTDALKRLYADAQTDLEVELPGEARALLDRLRDAKAEAKAVTAEVGELENQLRAWLGQATAGVLDGATVVTWKPAGKGRIDEDRLGAALAEQPALGLPYLRPVSTVVLDVDRLAADHPDFVAKYRRPSRRLVVKKEAYR